MGAAEGSGGAVAELVPLEVLERDLVAGWARQSAHLAAWLTLVAEFDRREGWAVAGACRVPTGCRGAAGSTVALPASTSGWRGRWRSSIGCGWPLPAAS